MRLLVALAAFVVAPAQAALIQIDLNGTLDDGQDISASLLFSTAATTMNLEIYTDANDVQCVGRMKSSHDAIIQHLTIGDEQLVKNAAGDGWYFSGDHVPITCDAAKQQFIAGVFWVETGDAVLSITIDPTHAVTLDELLGSNDPVSLMMLSAEAWGAVLRLDFDGVQQYGRLSTPTFVSVPEPTTLGLLSAGLLLLGFSCNRKRPYV